MTSETSSAPPVPACHGKRREQARRASAMLRRLIRGNPEPTPQAWTELGRALNRGDPEADALVAWMVSAGLDHGRRLFEQALEAGIETLAEPPEALRRFFSLVDRRPDWVDPSLLERGAEASNLCGMTMTAVLRDGALMGGYQASGLNRVLVMTGALEKGVGKRIAETATWRVACGEPGGMKRFGNGFKSTLRVRLVHALVRRHVAGRADWRREQDGVPINQAHMAATQLGFSALSLLGVRALGLPLSREDGRAFMHLMRYTGHLLGVEDALLPSGEQEGRRLLYHLALSLTDPDDAGRRLARALLDEPLHRPYRRLSALRGWYERERNLSVNRFFLGKHGMRALGLPTRPLPWYPLLVIPLNLLRFAIGTRSPRSRQRMALKGRAASLAWINSLTGATGRGGKTIRQAYPID